MRNVIMADFGYNLLLCRKKLAEQGEPATQEAVGALINVSGATISSWELANTFPSRENFKLLVGVFPELNKRKYKSIIVVDYVNATGPNNPNPAKGPRGKPKAKPNRVVKMANQKKVTPGVFSMRLASGRYKTPGPARSTLTRAINHYPGDWPVEARDKAESSIVAHFNIKNQKHKTTGTTTGRTSTSSPNQANDDYTKNTKRLMEELRFDLAGGKYKKVEDAVAAVSVLKIGPKEKEDLYAEVKGYFSVPDEPEVVADVGAATDQLDRPLPRTVLIPFQNTTVEAYRDQAGNGYWVQLSTVCDPIGVDTKTQRIKLQERSWADGKVRQTLTLHPDGTSRAGQIPWYIHSSVLPMWLANINENKISDPKIRAAIIRTQCELRDVLDAYFNRQVRDADITVDIEAFLELLKGLTALMRKQNDGIRELSEKFDRLGNSVGTVLQFMQPAPPPRPEPAPEPPPQPQPTWQLGPDGLLTSPSGERYINEIVLVNMLSSESGAMGSRITSEVLDFLCRKARIQGDAVKPDCVLHQQRPAYLCEPPIFQRLVGYAKAWARMMYCPFTTNGAGAEDFDYDAAFSLLHKTTGRSKAVLVMAEVDKIEKSLK